MPEGRRFRFALGRPSRIGTWLLAFNLLVVFVPVAGIVYLDVYEEQLLQAQERGMVQQARLVAAALGGGQVLDAQRAAALIERLGHDTDARIRVFDADGAVLADSASTPVEQPAAHPGNTDYVEQPGIRARLLYRVGARIVRVRRAAGRLTRRLLAPAPPAGTREVSPDAEVRAALDGRYGAAARPTPSQRSLTLNSALPIRSGSSVVIGAVVVSQSTFRILQALYEIRLRLFEIVVASVLTAVALSLVLSRAIVRPIVRLRRSALARAYPRKGSHDGFPGLARRDEIGDLARALDELTRRLDAHIQLLGSFAADVSHEFKNPLASIRTAAEMIASADNEDERQRFLTLLTRDIDRLERLVSGVRDMAKLDAQLAEEPTQTVDVRGLIQEVVDGLVLRGSQAPFVVNAAAAVAVVMASRERLAQVFENVLQNAESFAPADSSVEIGIRVLDGRCLISVDDRGPGIPPAHLERVFERFFTYRPGALPHARDHAGLGLSIAKAIVEGYGGTISAANREGGGTHVEISLPALSVAAASVR